MDLLTDVAAGSWRLAVHLAPPAELGNVRGLLALLGAAWPLEFEKTQDISHSSKLEILISVTSKQSSLL